VTVKKGVDVMNTSLVTVVWLCENNKRYFLQSTVRTFIFTLNLVYSTYSVYSAKVKVKWSLCRFGVLGSSIALLLHDHGTRRWWVVSVTLRSHFTPGKDPVPILKEARWAPGLVCMGGKTRPPPGFDPGPSSTKLSRYTDRATGPRAFMV